MITRMVNPDAVQHAAKGALATINPVTSAPSTPLEMASFIDSFGVSLMPRTSAMQGVVAGLNILAARLVARAVEAGHDQVVSPQVTLSASLAVRALVGGAGTALERLPEREDETLWRAGARSAGNILRAAAIGGAIYDVGTYLQRRYPARRLSRPMVLTALALGGLGFWASKRIIARRKSIQSWPVPQVNKLGPAVATTAVVAGAGAGIGKAFVGSRNLIIGYFGPGVTKTLVARATNAGLWAFAASTLYNAGVGYIGRANEKIDPGYAAEPTTPLVSGSADSFLDFRDLGQQGRRYVTDVITDDLIEEVMEETAVAHPIRTYVGYNTEPVYLTGRAELALAEMDRAGAFDRSYLLLVSPTGTGWIDHTMIEAAEFLTRGDIATCAIQYGRYPSFLSLQKVALGRRQFRVLLWGVKQRLEGLPDEKRPKVLIFGESLGAWASSDVLMYQGIGGFDHYGVDRALWVGLPGLAKWSRNGMARGSSDLVPDGTVGVFDHPGQLMALSDDDRDRLRAVILSHDNDPIASVVPEIAIKRPDWLGDERGRGVPDTMDWIPIVTFLHTAIDAANAMVTVPGEFLSFGHDYRADMAEFVHLAYHFPATSDEQIQRINETLKLLEIDRAERIKAKHKEVAPPAPSHRVVAGVPLQSTRAAGAQWRRSLRGLSSQDGTVQ